MSLRTSPSNRFLPSLFAACLPGILALNTPLPAREIDPGDFEDDWAMADAIIESIQSPDIPDRTFDITAFGAVGDGEMDARPAIQAAIEAAGQAGGGRVHLPAGIWLSKGPVHLRSRIDLHLHDDATLLFGPDPADYLPVVKTRWEGTELFGYSPLIYAANVHDVAITGGGLIDGNAASGFLAWFEKQGDDQQRLRQLGNTRVPVEKRVFGKDTYLRPSMIQFFHAERILLEDYRITNAPFWINHLVYTDSATVRNLKVESHFHNNDGVDVESSRFVLIEENRFRTGDDSVVVKSGRDADGRAIGRPSEYVVVRGNDMGGEDGIALGSEMSGDVRWVFFTDNILRRGVSAMRFKANLDRGGIVEHIRVRRMRVEAFEKHLIWFQLDYPGLLGGGHPSRYHDIILEDISAERAGIFLEAHAPKGAPLENVTLRNVEVREVEHPFILENVRDLNLRNVRLNGQRIDGQLHWEAP